jgi:hypothetical protein
MERSLEGIEANHFGKTFQMSLLQEDKDHLERI